MEPSGAALEEAVREILEDAKLDEVTHGIIRGKLEERFGLDLTGRKAAIKALTIQIISEKNKEGEAAEDEDEDEDEEEEEEEEEEDSGAGKKRRRGGGGFAAMVRWSDKMAEFLGTDSMPRTQVTKELWKYIKEKELQKPGDRRVIVCDDALHRLFNVKTINMLALPKAVNKHAVPTDGDYESEPSEADERKPASSKKAKKETSGGVKKAADKVKGDKKPRNMPKAKLSPELQAVIGEPTAARTEVVKRLWEYIREHNLQNPSDKRQILCDAKLKKVFEVDSVTMFGMNKLLSKHFLGKP